MRKSEIVSMVMSMSSDILGVEIRTADDDASISPFMVYIIVSTELPSDDNYNLRVNIMQRLDRVRPAGIGFEIMMKRPGDLIIILGAGAGAFGNGFDDNVVIPTDVGPKRTRFNALADELTAVIAPLKKPDPSREVPLKVPRLFEQTIDVKDRQVSPCPKCSCQAFTPALVGGRPYMKCRGCPLPAPLFPTNNLDAWGTSTQNYKCGSCGKIEPVTMLMSEINLYCGGCGKLSLHTSQKQEPKVITGSKATFTYKDALTGKTEKVEFTNQLLGDFTELEKGSKKYIPGKSEGSIKMTLMGEVPGDWVQAIERMNTRVASTYGMTYEELTASPAAGLWEMLRIKLELREWREFAERQREENYQRGLKERDLDRRTGRTTRDLLFAIAEYMADLELRTLGVVGMTERYTKDLVNLARDTWERCDLARKVSIVPIMPYDFDPQYDYTKSQRAKVFVDHTYAERQLQR